MCHGPQLTAVLSNPNFRQTTWSLSALRRKYGETGLNISRSYHLVSPNIDNAEVFNPEDSSRPRRVRYLLSHLHFLSPSAY